MKKLLIVAVLMVFILSFSGLYGQTAIGFNGIGGFIGYAMPEDPIESTFALGAKADLGTIFTPDIAFEANLAYWSKTYEAGTSEFSYTQIYLTAVAKYYFSSGSDLKPYVGGGLGFVHQSYKFEYSGPDYPYMSLAKSTNVMSSSTSDSEIDLAIHLTGGVSYKLSDSVTGFAGLDYFNGGADTIIFDVGAIFSLNK